MPISAEMQKIAEFGKKLDEELRADDPRLRHAVHVIHEDGTSLFIMNSFAVRKDSWYIILAEHYPPQYFHQDEVALTVWDRVYIGDL